MQSSTIETGIKVLSEYCTWKTSLYKNNLCQNNSTLFHHAKSASRCLWKAMMSVWDIDKTKNLTYGLKTHQTLRSVACLSETSDLLFTQQVGIRYKGNIFWPPEVDILPGFKMIFSPKGIHTTTSVTDKTLCSLRFQSSKSFSVLYSESALHTRELRVGAVKTFRNFWHKLLLKVLRNNSSGDKHYGRCLPIRLVTPNEDVMQS